MEFGSESDFWISLAKYMQINCSNCQVTKLGLKISDSVVCSVTERASMMAKFENLVPISNLLHGWNAFDIFQEVPYEKFSKKSTYKKQAMMKTVVTYLNLTQAFELP